MNAEESNFYSGDFSSEKELISYLDTNQVPLDKINLLIYKSNNGIIWDCNDPEKQKQIPSSFYEFQVDEYTEKYFRFEDGSFIKISLGGGEKVDVTYKNICNLYLALINKKAYIASELPF
ncbi:hypothetical protein [Bacillus kwashiorkori]|uniref:hypothetical protein n=1 Tax=Bacillus kwashiorkori TaxID=1522318 RepID=UPI00131A2171|nr:hypothetical protein [Bacillus kwashiorkori]